MTSTIIPIKKVRVRAGPPIQSAMTTLRPPGIAKYSIRHKGKKSGEFVNPRMLKHRKKLWRNGDIRTLWKVSADCKFGRHSRILSK
mmetsp:Transcript_8489/g.19838  ORF Transcript_8489/g.19838 Transcript_8489/m.19838 type:complete len:86 (-) Transcript_8489:1017-1274(-)